MNAKAQTYPVRVPRTRRKTPSLTQRANRTSRPHPRLNPFESDLRPRHEVDGDPYEEYRNQRRKNAGSIRKTVNAPSEVPINVNTIPPPALTESSTTPARE